MSDKDTERSHKVYEWARLQVDKRVGAGECWDQDRIPDAQRGRARGERCGLCPSW